MSLPLYKDLFRPPSSFNNIHKTSSCKANSIGKISSQVSGGSIFQRHHTRPLWLRVTLQFIPLMGVKKQGAPYWLWTAALQQVDSSISLTWSTRIFLFYYVKELLDFRILEGLTVNYLRGSKMTEARARGLKGVIRSCVMCFCSVCKGIQACDWTYKMPNK